MRIAALLVGCLFSISVCLAETITVDDDGLADFDNIQDAINYSWDGDTVLVRPGTYYEDVYFNGRAITVTGEDPNDPDVVERTIINGTVTFDMAEQEDSVLQGLALIGSWEAYTSGICTGTSDQKSPAISGETVVWSDRRNGNYDIYGYDFARESEFVICTAGHHQTNPAIDGDIVVWQDYRNGNYDIYGYDLSSGSEFAICTENGGQYSPAISGDTVVWSDERNGSYDDIYGYDLSSQAEFAICTESGEQRNPAIAGDIVVWSDRRSGNDDIYGYDLSTGSEFAICTENGNQYSVAIAGDIVVWSDQRNGDNDIYGYDLSSQTEFAICTESGEQRYAGIDGDIVIWSDQRNGDDDIYGYDLSSGTEFAICTEGDNQLYAAIDGDIVIWQDYRNNNWDIYGYENKSERLWIKRAMAESVVCSGANPTIRNDIIAGFGSAGIVGKSNGSPAIRINTIKRNGYGIKTCASSIEGNVITENDTGISDCNGTLKNNSISCNKNGVVECDGTLQNNTVNSNTGYGLHNCSGLISDNRVSSNGEGIGSCSGSITNNVVAGHSTGMTGCSGTIVNNTIIGNRDCGVLDCSAVVKNNIIAFNGTGLSGNCQNSYNCYWGNSVNYENGAYGKTGEFCANPRFASDGYRDANDFWVEGDYHLKSEAGRWDSAGGSWVVDAVTSRCIDSGDPYDPTSYEPNPNGGRINVGAYGGMPEASKSVAGPGEEPPAKCTEAIAGDVNNDCRVDWADFATVATYWLECNLEPQSACWE